MGKTVRRDVGTNSKVQQQYKNQNNVNHIMKQHARGINPTGQLQDQYLDLTEMPDPIEALNASARLKGYFSHLPPKTRQRFSHDPKELALFLQDPQNQDEAIKLGLAPPRVPIKAPKEPAPIKVMMVNPEPPKAS